MGQHGAALESLNCCHGSRSTIFLFVEAPDEIGWRQPLSLCQEFFPGVGQHDLTAEALKRKKRHEHTNEPKANLTEQSAPALDHRRIIKPIPGIDNYNFRWDFP
jgi:hypothetical protein